MKKPVIKIELDGKPIGTKPLLNNDSLISIREKIKEKVKIPYIFLDKNENTINKEDEENYILDNISVKNVIKIKSIEESKSDVNIFLNESNISCENISNSQTLDEIRNLIKDKVNCEF